MRAACSRRRKSVRAIFGSASSSSPNWPTPHGMCSTDFSGKAGAGGEFAAMVKMWGTPRASDGEKGGPNQSFTGGGIPLTAEAILWQTPTVAQFGKRRQVGQESRDELLLPEQTKMWRTPTVMSSTGNAEYPDARSRRQGREDVNLVTMTKMWNTPTVRDHKDGADPSGRVPTNGLLGRQAPRTLVGGPKSSESGLMLNPLFVEWMQMFPIGWTDLGPWETPSQVYKQRMRFEFSRTLWAYREAKARKVGIGLNTF